ncbi:glutaredoxin-like protein [Perilla frutescens var. hirtella]|nr:glutaredoxin-like protein [Perilla frutescens var. frutescens]KAH6792634.1 glutaredoxin-like protein [Perilla frutescens var. hirtella]
MSAILESYASDDRLHLDYIGISNSEEFRRYVNLVEDLQRVNLLSLSDDEKLAFFLNLHNSMAIHAVVRIGHPGGMIDRGAFFSDFMYVIGGHPYSLSSIKNGILRSNRRPPYSLIKPFSNGDKRLELAFEKVNRLIHFGIWNATRASPSIRFFKSQGIESELRNAAREYFQRDDGMQVDLAKRTVYLPRILKWYSADFGQAKEIPEWMIKHLDASKAGLLTHLMSDGGSVNIAYQDYDWSLNS